MVDLLNELLTWESFWRMALVVFSLGFFLALGMSIASHLLPLNTKKEITYDNLDKK